MSFAQRSSRTAVFLLASSSLLAVASGCNSSITGNEGNFQFSYPTDDRPLDFNKPIAVGATLEVSVSDLDRTPVELASAAFDDANILTVDSVSGSKIVIRAVASGDGLLTVEGETRDGEVLSDSVNFLARVPEVLKLKHSCTDGTNAGYLVGEVAQILFELEMDNGQPVIGAGYHPMTSSDDAAFAFNANDSTASQLVFDAGADAASVVLSSSIDDTTLDISVVSPASIDGVAQPREFAGESIDVGETESFFSLPLIGDLRICQASLTKTVTSNTPAICNVSDREADVGSFETGFFSVEGIAAGECEYTITYPAANAGAGASGTFTFTISE